MNPGNSLGVKSLDCRFCPWYGHQFVPATLKKHAKILLVGESPWTTECEQGRVFVGAAGQVLDDMLTQAGLTRSDVSLTNAIKCRPVALGQEVPADVQEMCTRNYLEKEIQRCKPTVIVPMGNVALRSISSRKGITQARGVLSEVNLVTKSQEITGIKVLPTFHPCLTGDTLIDCPRDLREFPDGIPMRDLVGKTFWTYAWNRRRERFVLRRVQKVWKTAERREIWELKFKWTDFRGQEFFGSLRGTPDHRILLQDQTYKAIADLNPGDRLVPLTRWHNHAARHSQIFVRGTRGSNMPEHRFVYQYTHGGLQKGKQWHIHHMDGNPINNSPDNLEQLSASAHRRGHTVVLQEDNLRRMRKGKIGNPSRTGIPHTTRSKRKISRSNSASWRLHRTDADKVAATERIQDYWNSLSIEEKRERAAHMNAMHAQKLRHMTARQRRKYWNHISQTQRRHWNSLSAEQRMAKVEKMEEGRRRKRAERLNHEVVSVAFCGYEDVYDMEVEKSHNFVANGIVVHNSYILRLPNLLPAVVADLTEAKRQSVSAEVVKSPPADYRDMTTKGDVLTLLSGLRTAPMFSCDTETTSLDYEQAELLSVGFSDRAYAAYVLNFFGQYPEKWEWMYDTEIAESLFDLLHTANNIAWQNMKYDLHILDEFFQRQLGKRLNVQQISSLDTMLCQHLLDENLPKSLKDMARLHTDILYDQKALEAVRKGRITRLPLEQRTAYLGKDCDATYRLAVKFHRELKAQGKWHLLRGRDYSDIEVTNMLYEMECFGTPVDTHALRDAEQHFTRRTQQLGKKMERLAGKPFNPNSVPKLREILFDDLRLPTHNVPRTSTGQPSTGKEALDILLTHRRKDPFLNTLLLYRKYEKFRGTNLSGFRKRLKADNRVHTDFLPWGTVSGRIVSTNPNIGNVPRDLEIEDVVTSMRKLFRARAGWVILSADYCLTGDTRVHTDYGMHSMRWLAEHGIERKVSALSISRQNTMEFQPIERAASIGMAKVYKVTLADGSSVRCTADHKWMDYEGNMVETRSLYPGQRLSHMYTCYAHGRPIWSFKGQQEYAHDVVADYAYGPKPVGFHVDHKDRDRANFSRRNLQYLPASISCAQGGQRYWHEVKTGERSDELRLTNLRQGLKRRRSYCGEDNPNYGKRSGTDKLCPVCGTEFYEFLSVPKRYCSRECYLAALRPAIQGNHSVVSVRYCGTEEVYQLTVAKNHNYVLKNGLISGNSQIEFKVAAIYSGDEDLLQAIFVDHEDFHTVTSRAMFPEFVKCEQSIRRYAHDPRQTRRVEVMKVRMKTIRTLSKNFNFGLLYGSTVDGLAEKSGAPVDEVREFVERLFARFPRFAQFIKNTPKLAIEQGYLETVYGRRRHFLPAIEHRVREEQGRQGINFIPQSTSALALRAALVRMRGRIRSANLRGFPFNIVYDSVLEEMPRTEVGQLLTITAEEMLQPVAELGGYTFSIDIGVGKTWQEAEQNAQVVREAADIPGMCEHFSSRV